MTLKRLAILNAFLIFVEPNANALRSSIICFLSSIFCKPLCHYCPITPWITVCSMSQVPAYLFETGMFEAAIP
ncbi:MAG: hypothetical protein ACI4B3_03570 [Prevotella sp.]